jgi:hypothetical protein
LALFGFLDGGTLVALGGTAAFLAVVGGAAATVALSPLLALVGGLGAPVLVGGYVVNLLLAVLGAGVVVLGPPVAGALGLLGGRLVGFQPSAWLTVVAGFPALAASWLLAGLVGGVTLAAGTALWVLGFQQEMTWWAVANPRVRSAALRGLTASYGVGFLSMASGVTMAAVLLGAGALASAGTMTLVAALTTSPALRGDPGETAAPPPRKGRRGRKEEPVIRALPDDGDQAIIPKSDEPAQEVEVEMGVEEETTPRPAPGPAEGDSPIIDDEPPAELAPPDAAPDDLAPPDAPAPQSEPVAEPDPPPY